MSHLIKNLLIVLVVVLVFFGVYLFMNSAAIDGGSATADEEIIARTNQILSDTKKVSSYELNLDIFSDNRFNTLQDFHTMIPDVSTGRSNPFLPVNQ